MPWNNHQSLQAISINIPFTTFSRLLSHVLSLWLICPLLTSFLLSLHNSLISSLSLSLRIFLKNDHFLIMAYLPLVLLLTSFSPNLNAFIFLSNAFQTIFEDFFLYYLPFGGWPSFCIFISSCLFLISWLSLVLTMFRWLMMYCSVGAIWWTYNDKNLYC